MAQIQHASRSGKARHNLQKHYGNITEGSRLANKKERRGAQQKEVGQEVDLLNLCRHRGVLIRGIKIETEV